MIPDGSQTSRPSSKRTANTSKGYKYEEYSRPTSSQVNEVGMVRSRSDFGMNKVQNNLAVGARRKTMQAANRQVNQSVR
jgi:hypothetical protein